ncbi:site-specific DNA-methyltransferase [Leptospira congkakensis]|uniref:Methyltransferase n=2 Tax=Leptospira congkakensis TaxID=2484932 RepID=A0A4Z1ABS7_9LEPT|nr:site-specific DNA-methyltransferase [Leptospira congkakensis]TGL96960.1 site-specific DNA-methyltransferase [Leptospira congkakensis]TGL97813.1 site-specific DNA-methyltransferase [Leptospira congkakensis]
MGRSAQLKLIHPTPTFEWENLFNDAPKPYFESNLGTLFDQDCMKVLPKLKENSIDTVFADPPFNIGKVYRKSTDDKRPDHEYLEWSKQWIRECVRVIKPGGALFLYNLPKWNILLGSYLNELGMEFRHWIAIELNMLLPIQGRLYPSHYSLLYYTKGKPKTFRKIRTPIELCRHCHREIKDYGGHRKAMNPLGVNLKDVWTDVPPVRHRKFKSENRKANALSTKITDRIIEMSTLPGDIVLDPFGGSGTTYISCENKHRHWIGIEIDYADDIKDRLESDDIHTHKNTDHVEE